MPSKRSTPRIMHRAGELRKEPLLPRRNSVPACVPCVQAGSASAVNMPSVRTSQTSARTGFLEAKGFRVLRFYNRDVMNDISGVMGVILDSLVKENADA